MRRIQQRFEELAEEARRIAATETTKAGNITLPSTAGMPKAEAPQVPTLDTIQQTKWQTSVGALLERVFGRDSSTFREFQKQAEQRRVRNPVTHFRKMEAIFSSAKEQYEGGYVFDIRNLVHADVFADELDQAKHFLDSNYKVAAAVVAGTVLETTMREMCSQHPNLAPADKLNKMNDDLAREGVYNNAMKQQITAWAAIRNSAAHGKPDEFEPGEVARMIDGIRDFVAAQMH